MRCLNSIIKRSKFAWRCFKGIIYHFQLSSNYSWNTLNKKKYRQFGLPSVVPNWKMLRLFYNAFLAFIDIMRIMNNDELLLIMCPFRFNFSPLFLLNFFFRIWISYAHGIHMDTYIFIVWNKARRMGVWHMKINILLTHMGSLLQVWSSLNTSSLKYII